MISYLPVIIRLMDRLLLETIILLTTMRFHLESCVSYISFLPTVSYISFLPTVWNNADCFQFE